MKLTSLAFFLAIVLFAVNANSRPPDGVNITDKSASIVDNDSWINANSILMFVSNVGWYAYDQGAYFGTSRLIYQCHQR